jgi:hypothetical protein
MTGEMMKRYVVGLGVSVSLSLAVATAAAAAPWSAGADEGTGAFAAGTPAVAAPNDGYSAYGEGPGYAPSYYDYYGGDDTVLARPAFPPGCGAGAPHC